MPGRLEFYFNDSRLDEFNLDQEVMTVGRKKNCDIRIDNLAVSSHHARLLNQLDETFIEDLGSTNGTYVNGEPVVSKLALQHGDVITIGKHELRYRAAGIKQAKLQILNGAGAGKELSLLKSAIKLGQSGTEVALISQRPDGHFIVKLENSDKFRTLVNGNDIGARAVKLENHDVIEINELKIEYFLSQQTPAA